MEIVGTYGILFQANILARNREQGTEYTSGSACLSTRDQMHRRLLAGLKIKSHLVKEGNTLE